LNQKDEEVLSKLYEARQKGISNWNSKGNYLYPYMATKEGYIIISSKLIQITH
jgi:hypothetical protein